MKWKVIIGFVAALSLAGCAGFLGDISKQISPDSEVPNLSTIATICKVRNDAESFMIDALRLDLPTVSQAKAAGELVKATKLCGDPTWVAGLDGKSAEDVDMAVVEKLRSDVVKLVSVQISIVAIHDDPALQAVLSQEISSLLEIGINVAEGTQ